MQVLQWLAYWMTDSNMQSNILFLLTNNVVRGVYYNNLPNIILGLHP